MDTNSPNAAIPGEFPYRWSVRKVPTLIVFHSSAFEEFWFILDESEDLQTPGLLVHVIVYMREGDKMVPWFHEQRHFVAESIFRMGLLGMPGSYVTSMDDLELEKTLVRQAIDEAELPESWRPKP